MEIKITRASINDLQTIQDLNNKLFELEFNNFDPALKVGWPYTKEGVEYFTEMINTEVVFLATEEDKAIGYLAGSINVENSCVTKSLAEVENMFILEEYRKYGLGTKLMNEFKRYCKKNNIEELKVTASAKNINAINFYQKNGFENFELTLKMALE